MRPHFIFLLFFQAVAASPTDMVDAALIGEVLGYPAQNLVVREVTHGEAEAREAGLIASYRVDGIPYGSFLPIYIYTAPKGVLLTKERGELIGALDEQGAKQGNGGFGSFELIGADKAAVLPVSLKMKKSYFRQNEDGSLQEGGDSSWTGHYTGYSVVATLAQVEKDVEVVVVLSGRPDKKFIEVEGGERYLELFHEYHKSENPVEYKGNQPRDSVPNAESHLAVMRALRDTFSAVLDSPVVTELKKEHRPREALSDQVERRAPVSTDDPSDIVLEGRESEEDPEGKLLFYSLIGLALLLILWGGLRLLIRK